MSIITSIFHCVIALFIVTSFPALAAETATDKLNKFVKHVATYKADFEQTVVNPQGKVLESASGTFILQRPGHFRWDYKAPYPQQIVADGNKIWFYDEDLEQVSVKSQKALLADTPATLLSGDVMPQDKYSLTNIPSDDGLLWVQLLPKEADSHYQTVTLAFDELGLRQMLIKDSFEQRTRLVFSRAVENVTLAKDTFVFVVPEGVDVVGE